MESQRLLFRQYTWDDVDFFVALFADPDVMRFIGEGRTWTRAEAEQRFTSVLKRYESDQETGMMLMLSKKDGERIGHAGLVTQTVEGVDETEVGYWIARYNWGQGLASEAAAHFRDYGFNQLGKRRLVSIIQFDNQASIGVAKKIGMSFEREVEYKSKQVALYSMEKEQQ